jgi:serine/threonine protein kinase
MPLDFCHTCFIDLASGEICSRCGEDRSSIVDAGDVLHPGSMLAAKYKVGRLLGRGGFGATYLAWDLTLRRRVAIKEFLPRQLASRMSGGTQVRAYTGSQDAFNIGLEKFLEEARHLAQFGDHPGIIRVLDFFEENGTGYMVMEYLDGSTLDQYVTTAGRLDIPVILELLIPVADALRACHAAGLIHRDISPDNIFLTSDGRVKLLDFGAARAAIGSQSTNLSVILKEGYAPFEQYQRNGRQGPWTDIYALTATLYRLLTGALPVTAPDRVAGTPLPSPAEKGVRLLPRLQVLLDKGLAIRAEDRYQTIAAFLADLKAVIETVSEEADGRIQPDGRRWKLILTRAGAIGLAGGVAALVAVWIFMAPPWVHPIPTNGEAPAQFSNRPPQEIAAPPRRPEVDDRRPATIASPPLPPPVAYVPPEEPVSLPRPPRVARARPEEPVLQTPPPSLARVPPEEPVLQAPPPRAPPITSTESAREYVKRAAEYQIRLRHAAARARGATGSLEKLRAIPTITEGIQNSIQTQENLYNSAIADRNALLNKYMAEVEWLGEHETATVDAALQLESDALATPSFDKGEADAKAEMGRAIKLLANHVRAQRKKQLKREDVMQEAALSMRNE